MSAAEVELLQEAMDINNVISEEDMVNQSSHFNDWYEEDEEDIDDDIDEEKEKEKIHKLRIHNGKVSYYRKIANNLVKIEAFTSPCNAYSYIRDPYTGALLPDRVGSRDEHHYFKVKMPCIGTGDQPIIFYYNTPEAFERHHLVKLPKDIVNQWCSQRNIVVDEEDDHDDDQSNPGFITVK